MRAIKLGALGALIVAAALALLWITEAVPRADVASMAPKAFGAIAVLLVAGIALAAVRGDTSAPDSTDKRVP